MKNNLTQNDIKEVTNKLLYMSPLRARVVTRVAPSRIILLQLISLLVMFKALYIVALASFICHQSRTTIC